LKAYCDLRALSIGMIVTGSILLIVFLVGGLPMVKTPVESMSCNCASFLTGKSLVTCNLEFTNRTYAYCNCLDSNLTTEKQQEICEEERNDYYNLTVSKVIV
jgi:hypothetical protein